MQLTSSLTMRVATKMTMQRRMEKRQKPKLRLRLQQMQHRVRAPQAQPLSQRQRLGLQKHPWNGRRDWQRNLLGVAASVRELRVLSLLTQHSHSQWRRLLLKPRSLRRSWALRTPLSVARQRCRSQRRLISRRRLRSMSTRKRHGLRSLVGRLSTTYPKNSALRSSPAAAMSRLVRNPAQMKRSCTSQSRGIPSWLSLEPAARLSVSSTKRQCALVLTQTRVAIL
mmetsp:Transcript_38399/g.65370  ORF Transcript_38399/g.65370 Transcript_38399/m.65370 type:complete len:225 (+) Transcript_38399:2228-2902(+)